MFRTCFEDSTTQEIADLKHENRHQNIQIDRLSTENHNIRLINDEVKSRLKKVEDYNTMINKRVSFLEIENVSLRNENVSLRNDNVGMRQEITTLRQEVSQLKTLVSQILERGKNLY